MAAELGEAFIPIRATLDKLDRDLADARGKVEGALSKIGGTVQKIGKVAITGILGGVAAVGVGIAAVANQAIPAASNLNEALNATNVVFGEAAGIVQEFGKTAADSAGLSEAAFNQLAATTGAMLQNYGLDSETAANATVDLGQRAADMASIFNTDVDQALTAINAALRGEADPIERFGVSMNAAAVQAKAMEMGLADSTAELDQAALTQARLALLFEQTDAIAGDFVNTSDQLANASRVQKARWENFMASIGSFALPILETFQGVFLDIGERVFPIVTEALAPIAEVVAQVAEAIGGFLSAVIAGEDPLANLNNLIFELAQIFGLSKTEAFNVVVSFQDLVAQIQEVIANVQLLLEPIISAVTSFVSWQDVLVALGIAIASVVIPAIISLVASMLPIILTVGAIIAVVALLRNAWENDWGGIRTSLTAWWEETGKPIFDALRGWLSENIPKAIQVLKNFWENVLKPAMEAVWSWLSTVLIPFVRDQLIPWLSDKLTSAIQTLTDFWSNTLKPAIDTVWGFLKEDVIPLFEALWELFNVGGALALEALSALWTGTLKPALDDVWSFIQTYLIPIFESLMKNINDDVAPVLQWLADTVLSSVSNAFDDIKSAIQFVIEKIKQLIEKLKSIELPSALTPGSPTPFELGLLGINKALGDFNKLLDQNGLLGSPSLNLNPAVNPLLGGLAAEGPGGNVTYNSNTTVNTNQDPLRVLRASRHLDKLPEIPV